MRRPLRQETKHGIYLQLTAGRLAIELHRCQGYAASCVLKEGG